MKTYNRIALSAIVAFSLSLILLLSAAGTPDRNVFGDWVLNLSVLAMVISLAVLVISTLVMAVREMDR